eukprot:TRINITY_DN10667_c0_g1_i1.p1 TRINITY_DN10667_c0_g1~~TRINITY_DN10667_c0_g1_i1.p1  ORF type:complete len:562 (-),score=103.81 TRINITY_DN10667_c0_g1_i1:56-1741(-)
MESECPVCNQNYVTLLAQKIEPKVLQCGHSLCNGCLIKMESQSRAVSCPFRCVVQPNLKASDIKTNFLAADLLRSLSLDSKNRENDMKSVDESKVEDIDIKFGDSPSNCENCFEKQAALLCTQCSALFCTTCFNNVHKSPALRNHRSKAATRKLMFHPCEIHHELRKFFCETDKELICRDCFDQSCLGAHHGHKVSSAAVILNSKFEELRRKVEKQAAVWEIHEQATQSALEKVETSMRGFYDSVQQIATAFKTLQQSLRLFKSQMMSTRTHLMKYLTRQTPAPEECQTFFETELPMMEKMLKSIDDQEGSRKLNAFVSSTASVQTALNNSVNAIKQINSLDVINAPRSSISRRGGLGRQGVVVIDGVSESGKKTCFKGSKEFEVFMTPPEAKFELAQENNCWVIRYDIGRDVLADCSVKFDGTLLARSPLFLNGGTVLDGITVTVSPTIHSGYPVERVFVDDANYWCSHTSGKDDCIVFGLRQLATISSMLIRAGGEGFARNISISISVDNSSWKKAGDFSWDGKETIFKLTDNSQCKFVRLDLKQPTSHNTLSLVQFFL